MKKIYRLLAILIAMVLVAGTLPEVSVSAATTVSVKAPKKALFVGGCTGTKASGKKAGYKSTLKVKSLLTGFDADTMTVKLSTSDKKIASVSNKTAKVKAVGVGTATITVKIYNKTNTKKAISTGSFDVTVKRNAKDADLTYKGITNGETYTVGQSLTVTLPKGTDTDKRRLTAVSKNVTVKSKGSNKWTVKIDAEGPIELKAEAYMSSSYKGATASKTIKATAESEDKPLVIGVEQKSLKSFVISGLQEEIEKEDIELYTLTGSDIKSSKNAYLNTVTYDDKTKTATVTTFSDLEGGVVYYVEVDGSVANFTAAKSTLEDVKKIELEVTEVKVNTGTPLTFKYFDAKGIDITSKVKSLVNATNLVIEITPFTDDAYIVGHDIYINSVDKSVGIKATLTTGFNLTTNEPIYVYGTGAVKSFQDKLDNNQNLFAITPDDGVYMTKKDAQDKLTVKIDDDVTLEALFAFTDKSYKTFNETNYAISSSNPSVLMIGSKSSTGGWVLKPVNVGDTTILISEGPVYDDTKIVASVAVKVMAARKAYKFDVKQSKTNLNINGMVTDYLYFTATAFDQYGDKIDGATFTIEEDANSQTATGTFSGLGFLFGACTIYNSSFTPSGNGGNHVIVSITCDNIENCAPQRFSIVVKDVAPTTAEKIYVPNNTKMTVDGDTTIDTMLKTGAQPNDPTQVGAEYTSEGFYVTDSIGDKLVIDPLKNQSTLTASYLGVAQDQYYPYFTLSYNGKIIDPDDPAYASLISYDSHCVEFKPFKIGAKLPKGKYTVTVYRLLVKDNGSAVVKLGSQDITVIDSTPDTYFTQIATEATGSLPGVLGSCFKLYYEGADVTSNIVSADYKGPDSNTGAVYVYSIKVGGLSNIPYGSFTVDIPIEALVYIK